MTEKEHIKTEHLIKIKDGGVKGETESSFQGHI